MEREIAKKMAYKWLNAQIKSWKLSKRTLPYEIFGTIKGMFSASDRELHISGVQKLSDVLDIPIIREDWDGNAYCHTNHDIIYFWYHGFKFFELVPKPRRTKDERQ